MLHIIWHFQRSITALKLFYLARVFFVFFPQSGKPASGENKKSPALRAQGFG